LASHSGVFVSRSFKQGALPPRLGAKGVAPRELLLACQRAAVKDETLTNDNLDLGFFAVPRDVISLAYLSFGAVFTTINILGMYQEYDKLVLLSLILGTVSAGAMLLDAMQAPAVPAIDGPGYMNNKTITIFGAAYMFGAMWVCFRTGPAFVQVFSAQTIAGNALLRACDCCVNLLVALVFVYGVVAPIATYWKSSASQPLSRLQAMLLSGSAIQNVIGATFLPVVLALACRGPLWWEAVHERWPMQQLLEPSTSTFAGLSVEAGLLGLRLAIRRKLTWTEVVQLGVGSAVVFALVPCACFLYFNDGQFDWFSLYSIPETW